MFCHQCGKELENGAAFCAYCGAKLEAPAQQPFQPYAQAPVSNPYFAPQGAVQSDVDSTKTLGLVALIVGIFVPLVGFICGGIGLSKIGKLKPAANPAQQEQLKKSKKLCLAGIIVPLILTVISIIVSIIWGIYMTKNIVKDYTEDSQYSFEQGDLDDFEDYLDEYGIESGDFWN